MINLISIILSLLLCQSIFPKDREISLSGTIQNFHGNKLPYATVRINNSGMGTVSDEYGIFKISLSRGIIDVTFSYVGYQSQSMRIILEQDTSIIAVLNISEIQMPEVMVVGEDPAYGIIREAIFRKNKWKAKLESYSAKVYTKDTFGTDSALGMISEAYSDIYWNRGDSLKEVVSYRRQSTNIPKEFQYALVRDFINFNDDSIHQWGYTFIAPLADSAFQYYDYHLIETSTRDDHVYYTIEVIPLTQIEPLFVGRIIIQDSSFALHRVVLNPNRIFTIPFMDIQNYEITEQYSLYDNQYWFPLEYHIRTNIKIRYILLNLPNLFHYTKSVVCYKYLPNTPICDSMKLQPNTTFLSSAQNYDTTEWSKDNVYPLSELEQHSYGLIDSLVRQNPLLYNPSLYFQKYENVLKLLELRYNRVEGLFVGADVPFDITSAISITINYGYGFSVGSASYSLKPEYRFNNIGIKFGFEIYRHFPLYPVNVPVKYLWNSLTVLFDGSDYYDYYLNVGKRVFIGFDRYPTCLVEAGIIRERQSSITKQTDFVLGWIGKSNRRMRPNEEINEGWISAIRLEAYNQRVEQSSFIQEPTDTWDVTVELASKNYGSDYEYLSVWSHVSVNFLTIGNSRLFNPILTLSASGGYTDGDPPVQKIFSFETPLSNVAFRHTFRTVSLLEFTGGKYYTFSAEHNFRNLPFVILGISSLNFDLLVRVAMGEMRSGGAFLTFVSHPTLERYYEYSLGIGRIGDLLRLDLSYSDYQSNRYAITLSGSM